LTFLGGATWWPPVLLPFWHWRWKPGSGRASVYGPGRKVFK
jgi:hypothetical protein